MIYQVLGTVVRFLWVACDARLSWVLREAPGFPSLDSASREEKLLHAQHPSVKNQMNPIICDLQSLQISPVVPGPMQDESGVRVPRLTRKQRRARRRIQRRAARDVVDEEEKGPPSTLIPAKPMLLVDKFVHWKEDRHGKKFDRRARVARGDRVGKKKKRPRFKFDSTLGYPGEGPQPGPKSPKGGEKTYQLCPEPFSCKKRLHFHPIKSKAKSGAAKRLAEKAKRKARYYRCKVEACGISDHFHFKRIPMAQGSSCSGVKSGGLTSSDDPVKGVEVSSTPLMTPEEKESHDPDTVVVESLNVSKPAKPLPPIPVEKVVVDLPKPVEQKAPVPSAPPESLVLEEKKQVDDPAPVVKEQDKVVSREEAQKMLQEAFDLSFQFMEVPGRGGRRTVSDVLFSFLFGDIVPNDEPEPQVEKDAPQPTPQPKCGITENVVCVPIFVNSSTAPVSGQRTSSLSKLTGELRYKIMSFLSGSYVTRASDDARNPSVTPALRPVNQKRSQPILRSFREALGWKPTGYVQPSSLEPVAFHEFSRVYTHCYSGSVYTDLVRAVVNDADFMGRGVLTKSGEMNANLSQKCQVVAKRLLGERAPSFTERGQVYADTVNFCVNRLYFRERMIHLSAHGSMVKDLLKDHPPSSKVGPRSGV